MNFLAHLYLSRNNKECIIGNFIADHVKGSKMNSYSNGIKAGILFHRKIDQFTDSNPVVQRTVLNLRPYFRKYSGVVLDMFYDHFLGNDWSKYSDSALEDFTDSMYSVLNESFHILPPRSQFILPYMMGEDWLTGYRTFEGLNNALTGISQRTTFYSNLDKAVEYLKDEYELYKDSFDEFFPQLVEYSKKLQC